jgi:deoxyribonuclease-4
MARIGCHLSIAGGFKMAARRALELGCESVQVFSRSPRGGKAKTLDAQDVLEFRETLAAGNTHPAVIHAPYYINLAADDPNAIEYTREIVVDDLVRAAALGASYVVVHMGTSARGDAQTIVARMLDSVFARCPENGVLLLLENTAGQGKEIGHALGYIADTIGMCSHPERIGFCFDTSHAYGAGYDVSNPRGIDQTFKEMAATIGIHRLKVIHANDSKEALGSRRDRHEHIGKGLIGRQGFRNLLARPETAGLPFILETPLATYEANKMNLDALFALREQG